MDEKFLNTDEMMVDYAEMTSFNFNNNSYWAAGIADEENEKLLNAKTPAKMNLLDVLQNMVSKFSFHKVEA